ncbi:MAG: hypothetical protein ABSG33_01375 [Candidatus Bathyarchaeia archaeon]
MPDYQGYLGISNHRSSSTVLSPHLQRTKKTPANPNPPPRNLTCP